MRIPGCYTFVRHLGKMGPPSSLLFLTVVENGRGGKKGERIVGERMRGKKEGREKKCKSHHHRSHDNQLKPHQSVAFRQIKGTEREFWSKMAAKRE